MEKLTKMYIFLLLFISIYTLNIENVNKLYQWGIEHGVYFNKDIQLNPIDNEYNLPYFTAKNKIENNTLLISIPLNLSINSTSIVAMMQSKKLKKIFNDLKNVTNPYLKLNSTKDMLLISLGLYFSAKSKNQKKFGQIFGKYFDFYEHITLDFYPLNYDIEELNYIYHTDFAEKIRSSKRALESEVNIIKKEFKIDIEDEDDFINYRILASSNAINHENTVTLVPFMEFLIKEKESRTNAKYFYNNKTNSIDVVSINPIEPDKLITLISFNLPNSQILLYFGYTIEDNPLSDNLIIDYIYNGFKEELGVKNEIDDVMQNYSYDLSKNSFVNDTIEQYNKMALKINKYKNERFGGIMLLRDNLNYKYKYYSKFTVDQLKKVFSSMSKITHIKRVIDYEMTEIKDRLKYLEMNIELLKKEAENERNDKSDL